MAGYRVVLLQQRCAELWSTDQSLAHDVFADVQARLPKAELSERNPMPDGTPCRFDITKAPPDSVTSFWLLKLFCERGGEPFAVDEHCYYVRFKD